MKLRNYPPRLLGVVLSATLSAACAGFLHPATERFISVRGTVADVQPVATCHLRLARLDGNVLAENVTGPTVDRAFVVAPGCRPYALQVECDGYSGVFRRQIDECDGKVDLGVIDLAVPDGTPSERGDRAGAVGDTRAESETGKKLVRQLTNPKKRNRAYCELLDLGLHHGPLPYRDECRPVTQVVTAPQEKGPPLHLVFCDGGFPITRGPQRRNAAGPFSIFDDHGFIVPVFQNANLIDEDSELFTFSPDGRTAVGHVFSSQANETTDSVLQLLHIIPTTAVQTSALSVILGPALFGFEDECEGYFWTWHPRDRDGDGWPEIEIGPRVDDDDRLQPVATFRWSEAERRYVGPAGSPSEGFEVFTSGDAVAQQEFAAYWRDHLEQRVGQRRYQCESGAGSSGGVP